MKRHFSDKEALRFSWTSISGIMSHWSCSPRKQAGRSSPEAPAISSSSLAGRDGVRRHRRLAGRGIGSILMRHLAKLAGEAGLRELTAEVLPENAAMLNVFRKFGFKSVRIAIHKRSIWF